MSLSRASASYQGREKMISPSCHSGSASINARRRRKFVSWPGELLFAV
jgi:hypothetical protein